MPEPMMVKVIELSPNREAKIPHLLIYFIFFCEGDFK